jgi:small subunit ribosomal protein S4
MPIRKHKKYNRPRKIFDIALIKEEKGLIKKYGLKNRREVWKASFQVNKIRSLAKDLITANEKEKSEFVERQRQKGFSVNNITEILALTKEDYMKRRLQSIVVQKGYAKTHKQARQLITHKHITINGNSIDSPSHITTLKEEAEMKANIVLALKKELSKEEKQFLKQMNNKENKEEKEE